jgi:hypothetical protein
MNTESFQKYAKTAEEALEAAKLAIKNVVTPAAKALLSAFFEAHPEVCAVAWSQESNHYDDETYSYRVSSPRIRLGEPIDWSNVDDTYDNGDDGNDIFVDGYDDLGPQLKSDLSELGRLMTEEIFRPAFGEDVFVIATREEFHVTDNS